MATTATAATTATTGKATAAKAAAVVKGEVENEALREMVAAKAAGGAKGVAVAKGAGAKGAMAKAAGAKVAGAKVAGATGAGAAGAAGATKAAGGGLIWTGKGMSLGLGLGLGAWGPAIVLGVGALAVYGYMRNRQAPSGIDQSETDLEIQEALA